mmetsp:Transcript_11037/g.40839  ORF Transcript_11037/g.40839 Transcript_11037/m.40839 type:complete len:213 (-) Transcript_11037:583-1221(-)
MPHVSSRHDLFFETPAYDHTRPIATSHSTSENTCTPQVGTESALGGPVGKPGAHTSAENVCAAARKFETNSCNSPLPPSPRSSSRTNLESSAIKPNVLTSATPAAASTSCAGRSFSAERWKLEVEAPFELAFPPSPPAPQSTLTNAPPRALFKRPSQPSPSHSVSPLCSTDSVGGVFRCSVSVVSSADRADANPAASRNANITRKLVSEIAA